jgi:hypothetical protein
VFTKCCHCGGMAVQVTSFGSLCADALAQLRAIGFAAHRDGLSYRWNWHEKRGVFSKAFAEEVRLDGTGWALNTESVAGAVL